MIIRRLHRLQRFRFEVMNHRETRDALIHTSVPFAIWRYWALKPNLRNLSNLRIVFLRVLCVFVVKLLGLICYLAGAAIEWPP
jgi:hypothetical protein